jgi:ribose transport system permease protein
MLSNVRDQQVPPATVGNGGSATRRLLTPLAGATRGPLIALVLLFCVLCVTTPSFLSVRNYLNIVDQVTRNGIIALGMTFVVLTGGIDLSVGSTFVLSMMTFGVLAADFHVPIQLSMLAGIAAAASCGMVNGLLVAKARLPAFLATMAMMSVARGVANVVSGMQQRYDFEPWFSELATKTYLGFLPLTTILFGVLIVGSWLMLSYRFAGRGLYAIGGNAEVARLAGVRVPSLTVSAYVLSAAFAGLAGIVQTSRLATAQPYAGEGYELDAIAAVVIGGASLTGGVGTIGGTVIGVLITGILRNGLNLNGVGVYVQTLLIGVVIAASVAVDVWNKRRQ